MKQFSSGRRVIPARSGTGRLVWIALDLALWLIVPAIFLWFYVAGFSRPGAAVIPHLRIVANVWLLLVVVRLLVRRRWRDRPAPGLLLGATLASGLVAWLIFYGLVLTGLTYWNQVISWDLIVAYSGQARPLAAALGVSLRSFVLAAIGVHLMLWAACHVYLLRFDWTRTAALDFHPSSIRRVTILALILTAIQSAEFMAGSWGSVDEPLSLAFRPPSAQFQNHALDGNLRLDNNIADQRAREDYVPAGDADRRNLVLIVVDGLRPDHMGVLGYERDTTPVLSSLAAKDQVRHPGSTHAICSESLCGLLGIAASRYIHRFSDQPFTLQEVLRMHGYRVHMFLSGDHTNFYGLKELYGEIDTFMDGTSTDEYLNDDGMILSWLQELPPWDGAPAMLQFHLMSAHLLAERPSRPVFSPAFRYGLFGTTAMGDGQVRSPTVVNFYDSGVWAADHVIGRILHALDERQYLSDALVVVTSDHGEALGEHGLFGHAKSVHGPGLAVPLLLVDFPAEGRRPSAAIDPGRVASQIDLAPTILHELDIPRPASWLGEPVQEPLGRRHTLFQQGQEVGLIDHTQLENPWKFWIHVGRGEHFVYNLRHDPDENCNLATLLPAQIIDNWIEVLEKEGALAVHSRTIDRANEATQSNHSDCSSVHEFIRTSGLSGSS